MALLKSIFIVLFDPLLKLDLNSKSFYTTSKENMH